MILGIDASRCLSGGAIQHITGILGFFAPSANGFSAIHLWADSELLAVVPNKPWLIKHESPRRNAGLLHKLMWQRFVLLRELNFLHVSVLFSADAATVCGFSPVVVLSQDLLAYEAHACQLYGLSRARLRLAGIRFVQNRAFRRSNGVIFLTKYASCVIERVVGPLRNVIVIPHGVMELFSKSAEFRKPFPRFGDVIRCIYVSNIAPYKHQINVARAIAALRRRGYLVQIEFVGGGGWGQGVISEVFAALDPERQFLFLAPFLSSELIAQKLAESDIFVFASSCEAFGITLLEGMAAGIPICCSNRSSLPETLGEGGVEFDPFDPVAIADSIEQLINDSNVRLRVAQEAQRIASIHSWQRCSDETFSFVKLVADKYYGSAVVP